jgi:hypothetical protein
MEVVDIPLAGGPLDSQSTDVEVDDDGFPPDRLPQTDLWFA